MTEIGFYHPSRGYWQTTNRPSAEFMDQYPEGTVEVPLQPGPDYEFDGTTWNHAPKAPNPVDYPLQPYQFHAMLEVQALTEPVNAAIAAMPNPQERAVAKAKLDRVRVFHRDDPLISQLAVGLDLTDEQIDAMWLAAKDI